MNYQGNIQVNGKQIAIFVGWLVLVGLMHSASDPIHGYLGTALTVMFIGIVSLAGIFFLEGGFRKATHEPQDNLPPVWKRTNVKKPH